jgi:hypothetical protein
MTTSRALIAGFAVAAMVGACADPSATPSPSTAAASVPPPSARPAATPIDTPTPFDTPAPTPSRILTDADLPKIDPAEVFGQTAKLTGTDDTIPGQVARGAVLASTGGHFGYAVECVGNGPLTVTVTRPLSEPADDGSTFTVLSSSSVMCPTPALQTFEYDTGEADPKTSLNIGVEDAPSGVYWRAILVDLEPGTSS